MSYQFEIITDSTANLPEDMIEKYQIHILPLSFMIDEIEYSGYEKGKTTDLSQFYTKMREKKNVKTSLANSQAATDLATEVLRQEKDILYIGFSSGLSSTYHAVSTALEELKEEYTKRKILHVDSLSAALGEGLLVHYAIEMREKGKTIEEVYQWQVENRFKLCHWFTVDDLFFLKRGGRVSGTTAVLGTALNIKPVLHVDEEGHLIPVMNVRGRKKSLDALMKRMVDTIIKPEEQVIYISHGDCLEDAEYVANKIKELLFVKEIMLRILDPVIGAHSGPGTIALFFMGTKR